VVDPAVAAVEEGRLGASIPRRNCCFIFEEREEE